MKKKHDPSRRDLIKSSVGGLAGLSLFSGGLALGSAPTCDLTIPQGEGPYYPEEKITTDSDLTSLRPGDARATGQVIYVVGTVADEDCRPLPGARVEIWQACYSGKYNHSQDPNPLPLDKNFQYWGKATADEKGNYMFKTIVPGHYPTGGGHYRPPHIHYKAYAQGHFTLTTQSYFDPRSYDDAQLAAIVKRLNEIEDVPAALTILYSRVGEGFEPGAKMGKFDITLEAH
jgi:protocatechuate 3,4-dioxygenase beta subunit